MEFRSREHLATAVSFSHAVDFGSGRYQGRGRGGGMSLSAVALEKGKSDLIEIHFFRSF